MSDDNNLGQIGMLFLSDLSRQESDEHTTSQQEFDVTEVSDGPREIRFTDNKHTKDRVRGGFQSTSLALLTECAEVSAAQSVRILELQIEMDKLEFLEGCTKRARCEVTRRTTPT